MADKTKATRELGHELQETDRLMAALQVKVFALRTRALAAGGTWADVGDAQHINDQLRYLLGEQGLTLAKTRRLCYPYVVEAREHKTPERFR